MALWVLCLSGLRRIVMTIGAFASAGGQPSHLLSQKASFPARPLVAAVEVTGHGLVDIWIVADGSDASLFAYLDDVAPDGSVRVVTDGRLKASQRKPGEAPWAPPVVPWHRVQAEDVKPLQPNAPARLQFDLLSMSHVFAKGHRILLIIPGSDHRERARDPAARPKSIILICDRTHRSSINLPILRS